MSELDDLTDIAKKVKSLQRRADKAQGAVDNLKKRLLEEHGCISLEDARVLLVQHEKDEKRSEKKFRDAHKAFQERWEEVLDG